MGDDGPWLFRHPLHRVAAQGSAEKYPESTYRERIRSSRDVAEGGIQ